MKPLYIFDLDGTLALTEHRAHYLGDKNDPMRWRKFYAACVDDQPNEPVLRTFNMLRSFADVWIWSGRSAEVRPQTVAWLATHTRLMSHEVDGILLMRDEGDYTADHDLKRFWLDNMLIDDRRRLIAIFDDRGSVVEMWRAQGVACFQVAPGEF